MLQLFSGYFLKNSFGWCHIFMWLLKLMILDVYICPWLLRDNSDSCWWNSDRMYIYVVGCLDACTVVAPWVQQGRIYMPLACKGIIFKFPPNQNVHLIYSWFAQMDLYRMDIQFGTQASWLGQYICCNSWYNWKWHFLAKKHHMK